jgi:hypothetical protein
VIDAKREKVAKPGVSKGQQANDSSQSSVTVLIHALTADDERMKNASIHPQPNDVASKHKHHLNQPPQALLSYQGLLRVVSMFSNEMNPTQLLTRTRLSSLVTRDSFKMRKES